MVKISQPHLRLVTVDGVRVSSSKRRRERHSTSQLRTPLDGHLAEPELATAQRFDLPSPPLGDLVVPHRDGFTTDAERVGEGLMGPSEVLNDLIECHHGEKLNMEGQAVSVSMLPSPVKRLTGERKRLPGNLPYMTTNRRVATDRFAIERGKKMLAARERLGVSQESIAKLVERKREFVSQCEHGLIVTFDRQLVKAFAGALGLPPQELTPEKWEGADETIDLRISNVARHLAYSYDQYPLLVQNQIRQAIANYEKMKEQVGAEKAREIFTPPATSPAEVTAKPSRTRANQHAPKRAQR